MGIDTRGNVLTLGWEYQHWAEGARQHSWRNHN
uniref:Uncharacterized protein n=1 Tax=Tetraselmis sp. GSL018 TaxID=582737 RepID=A0A061RCG0_9CHLO